MFILLCFIFVFLCSFFGVCVFFFVFFCFFLFFFAHLDVLEEWPTPLPSAGLCAVSLLSSMKTPRLGSQVKYTTSFTVPPCLP